MYLRKECIFILLFLKGEGKICHHSISYAVSKRKPRTIAEKRISDQSILNMPLSQIGTHQKE